MESNQLLFSPKELFEGVKRHLNEARMEDLKEVKQLKRDRQMINLLNVNPSKRLDH